MLTAGPRRRQRGKISRADEFAAAKRAYAKQVMAAAGVADRRIEAAFAMIEREKFLDPGPWQIVRWGRGYVPTPSADPVYLYDDVVVAILPERNLNNGQPSLHAMLIAAAAPRAGDHAVHIGVGGGYYTAILAHLVGTRGRVTAIEYDPALAERAARNLAGFPNVTVVHGDGTQADFAPADVIYTNAGATRPADTWLDRLKDGGRLILMLTEAGFPRGDVCHGAVFRIERRGDDFLARRVSAVGVFPCAGGRDPVSEQALAAAFEKGGAERVTRLYRRDDLPDDQCWVRGPGWCLAYA
jgi:protein-L-isoaspartate(D-aspartate) O-methyltransferase